MPDPSDVLLIAALLLLSGYFSCSETALFSLSRYRVKRLRDTRGRRGRIVSQLLSDPVGLLITILLGNMLVNVAASAFAERISSEILGPKGLGVSVVVMTMLLLVFGEVTPKAIAVVVAERVAVFSAPFLSAFGRIIQPLRLAIRKTSDVLVQAVSPSLPATGGLNAEELATAISLGQERGELDADERVMMENILLLSQKTTGHILTPRNRIFGIDLRGDIEAQRKLLMERKYSRIPVYEGTLDKTLGILHIKDALMWVRGTQENFNIRAHLREVDLVPKTMPVEMLLRRFQRSNMLLSLVIDEYGRLAGLVTLQDIIRELITGLGEAESLEVRRLPDGGFVAQSDVTVETLLKRLGVVIDAPPRKTLGNLIEEAQDGAPEPDDTLRVGEYVLSVHTVRDGQVAEVAISRYREDA